MPMKRVWVMTQKQTSKGYFSRRAWGRKGKPVFTRIMANAIRFDTEPEIVEYKNKLIAEITNDVNKAEISQNAINKLASQQYIDLKDFETKVNNSGVVSFYNSFFRNRDRSPQDVINETFIEWNTRFTNETLDRKAELKFVSEELYCRNVPVGIRFIESRKCKVDFIKNDSCSLTCIVCGGVVPDVTYLSVGYSVRICACCLDAMMPDIKKAIDETEAETKDIWSKERFLTGLE